MIGGDADLDVKLDFTLTPALLAAIPGALLAVHTLYKLSAAAFERERSRHIERVEKLSKVVEAAGENCPKALRIELVEEVLWVASYKELEPTELDDFEAGIFVVLALIGFLAPLGLLLAGAPDAVGGIGAIIGFGVGCLSAGRSAAVTGRLRSQRHLWVMLGGHRNTPALPPVSWGEMGAFGFVDEPPIELWIGQAFGGHRPDCRKVSDAEVESVRASASQYFSEPTAWGRAWAIAVRARERMTRRTKR